MEDEPVEAVEDEPVEAHCKKRGVFLTPIPRPTIGVITLLPCKCVMHTAGVIQTLQSVHVTLI